MKFYSLSKTYDNDHFMKSKIKKTKKPIDLDWIERDEDWHSQMKQKQNAAENLTEKKK